MRTSIPSTRSPEAIASELAVSVADVRTAIDRLKIQPAIVRSVPRYSTDQVKAIAGHIALSSSRRLPRITTGSIKG